MRWVICAVAVFGLASNAFADDLDILLRKWDRLARAIDKDNIRRSSSTLDPAGGRAKG